jgi:hypothetical protein
MMSQFDESPYDDDDDDGMHTQRRLFKVYLHLNFLDSLFFLFVFCLLDLESESYAFS